MHGPRARGCWDAGSQGTPPRCWHRRACLLSREGPPAQGREVLQPPPLTQARLTALSLGAVSSAEFSSARAWFIFLQENHQRQRGS